MNEEIQKPRELKEMTKTPETWATKEELSFLIAGQTSLITTKRRIITGAIAGAIVGFVEAGVLPRTFGEMWLMLGFIGLRIATGVMCATIPWRAHALFRGIVFSLLTISPMLFLLPGERMVKTLLMATLAGVVIGYWTERFGIPKREEEDEIETS
ncbi:MAG: hypothetical protein OEM52_06610 [bacterium]|nr:hypothetical protein [bacterium]